MAYNGVECHDALSISTKQKLAFNENNDYFTWKAQVKEKLTELLGMDVIKENVCDPQFKIEEEIQKDGYKQIRFSFYSEVGAYVPCYLLVPNDIKGKLPVAIVLQGHNEMGFASSIGRVLKHETAEYDAGNGMFAVQAVKNGYIALAIEQRGMGERKAMNTFDRRVALDGGICKHEAMTAILLGRTLIGERVHDISAAIDQLSNFDCCDVDKIIITGNSGGGTATYYSACFDERIKYAIPSCAVCAFKDSIAEMWHCTCNYVPHMAEYFDMGELACLIAPRKLLVIYGAKDPIFPIKGTHEVYSVIEKIYKKENAADNCRLVVMPERPHYFDSEVVFGTLKEARK
jgi:cephalosporin-C deacetylase-like acetyl esterase